MAKKKTDKPGIVQRVQLFMQDVRAELNKVTWPSWDEVKATTTVIMILLVIMAGIVFVMDQAFSQSVAALLKLAG